MAQELSLDELQKLEHRGRAAFDALNERIAELQRMSPGAMMSGRNNLGTWDRYTVTQFSKHLDHMEEIASPTREQRLIMAELHKLVSLGDHMIEKTNVMQALMKEKAPKIRKRKDVTMEARQAQQTEVEEEINPGRKASQSEPKVEATSSKAAESKPAASEAPPRIPTPAPIVEETPSSVEPPTPTAGEQQRANNLLAYDMLGMAPDAPLAEIKKWVMITLIIKM